MDNQQKLNDLFRKAKEQEPVTSFDQTKEHFLNSLGNQFIKTKDASVFNYKKWIIMLSSIISIVGITLFISSSHLSDNKVEKKKQNLTHSQTVSNRLNSKPSVNKDQSKLISETHNTEIISNLINEEPFYLKNELGHLPSFDLRNILQNHYQNIPFDDTLKTGSITIPILSEKEVKANNKQKKSILKAAIKEDLESYCYVPSGSFNYEDQTFSVQGFYIRKTEVTNLEYRTFLNDLIIQKRFEEYKLAKPDDSLWFKMYGKGMEMMSMYTTHPAYNNYPITNITRKGAELYIQWLNSEIPPKEKDIILTDFRIPTRIEWVYAASSQGKQFPYPWNGEFMRDSKGLYLANYKPFPQRFADDGGFSAVKVDSYHPNQLGLYNMSGNVAEMVDNMDFIVVDGKKIWTKVGIGTAGGGWLESAEDIKITAKDNYDGISLAHPNIGFRYVKTFRLKGK
jgi:formylglycine-generating enzyme required for sulfatase activity